MHPHRLRIALGPQFPSAILEIANQFLLLRIDGDHWLLPAQRPLHFAVEVFELGIAIRVAGAFGGLAVGLQTVPHLMEQVGHYLVADSVMSARSEERRVG